MSADVADDRPRPDLLGEILANRYQIESRLGEGAMGAVYKAKHIKVGRPFAVKVLHKKLIEDRKVLQRFEREAELAGRLRHPNVVGVVDVGETADGFRYMVMDFAEGHDLATLLNDAPFTADRVVNLTRQMLEGLYHAHEQGLIHRDFKPENVIIELDDHGTEVPRIVDFGIAILREGGESASATGRLTTNGLVLGTPHYMAPEQAVADPIDHRIDLFALGIVIYEMLCGKLPFDGTGAEVARANLLLDPPLISQRVPYLEVDPLLEAFARRLMAKKREMRPTTAKAARELLDLIINDPPAAAAALGVPLAASSRQPAITQPSTPLGASPEDMLDVAIESESPRAATAPPMPRGPSSAQLEAPAYPTPALANLPKRSQRDLRTDVSSPLAYGDEPPQKSRGMLVVLGIGGLAIAGIVAFFALRSSKSDDSKPVEPTKVVMQADPAPAPPPKPVQEPPKPVVDDPPAPADVAPPAKDPVVDPVPVKPPVISKKPPPVIARNPVVKDEPKPQQLPADLTMTKKGGVLSASALNSLYVTVGRELAEVAKINPVAAERISTDYRRIQIVEAMSTEANRQRYGADLERLRARLAAAKKKL